MSDFLSKIKERMLSDGPLMVFKHKALTTPDYCRNGLGDALFKNRIDRIGLLIIISHDQRERQELISILTGRNFSTKNLGLTDRVSIEFGKIQTRNDNSLEILGFSTQRRLIQMLDKLAGAIVGFVFIIRGEENSELGYLGYLINYLKSNFPVPNIIGIRRASDTPGLSLEFLRCRLRLDQDHPMIELNFQAEESVQALLRELVNQANVISSQTDKEEVLHEPSEAILRTEGLVKIYRKRKVVNRVTVAVEQGEIIGLLGPNGAGKTTTFYMITGMIRPNSGKIYLYDKDITRSPMYKRARMGIGYLCQEPSIFRRLTVEQNILSILQTLPISRQEQKVRLEALLEELNLSNLARNKAYTLSGGERRRVEITRALVTRPKFMLLDEPFAGVDPISVEEIQNIVKRLKHKGIGVLITDHNIHETLSITDRVYLLYDGVVLKSGTSQFLANDPEALKFYLGERFKLDR